MNRNYAHCILIELLYRDYAGTPIGKSISLVELTIFQNLQPAHFKDIFEQ